MSISRKNEKVNCLTAIRENGVTTDEIVDAIREVFPKHNKTLLTRCERPAEYGIELRPKAIAQLRERFGEIKAKGDGHKLTNRLACRVPTSIYNAFKALAAKKDTTVNSLIYACALERLREERDPEIAYQAQKDYCAERNVPMFAPKTCFACYGDVLGGDGRSVLYCAGNHITSCPHCRKSFID